MHARHGGTHARGNDREGAPSARNARASRERTPAETDETAGRARWRYGSAVDPPRVVRLSDCRVVQMVYAGARPPAAEFLTHWRRFRDWTARHGLQSALSDVAMIGYEPPGPPGSRAFCYRACMPVPEGYRPDDDAAEIDTIPAGSYVLCRGELPETPQLFRAARRYAAEHGLAVERGGIEIFRPDPRDPQRLVIDAGCRIHA